MKDEPKYILVKRGILQQILNGELHPKDKLLSECDYANLYQVSNITVRKALSELVDEGYIYRVKGKGSFVKSRDLKEETSNKLIALILSAEDYYDTSYMHIIKGAQKMLSEYGYSLIVEWSDGSDHEQESIQKMISQGVAGFLIYPFNPDQSITSYDFISNHGLPFVLLDRYTSQYPAHFAGCDNYRGAIQATNELLKRNHTKIKFISYHFFLSSEKERFDGYCSAMWQAGLPITSENLICDLDYEVLSKSILSRETTALFCCNDRLAIKVIKGLQKYKIRIPQDVSIIGFDDWENSQCAQYGLSTVRQDFQQIGSNAANLLINVIQGKFKEQNIKILSNAQVIIRESICEN